MNKDKILIVVDMQNDFISGSLGSSEAQAVVDRVCEKIRGWDGLILATMDTHGDDYLSTFEGLKLPVKHCIRDTDGWKLHSRVEHDLSEWGNERFMGKIVKDSFESIYLPQTLKVLQAKHVEIVGLCTDICVISNAFLIRSLAPDMTVTIDASCCAGSTPENHISALRVLKACCFDVTND